MNEHYYLYKDINIFFEFKTFDCKLIPVKYLNYFNQFNGI